MKRKASRNMIRAGVIGVGNCFSGLVQGIEFYRKNPKKEVIGLMHPKVGGYEIYDIEFVSAFDVAKNKIGKPLHMAVQQKPNKVDWIKLPKSKTIVKESPVLDGVGIYVENLIDPVENEDRLEELKAEIVMEIKRTKTEVLVNYLPVGSDNATKFWAQVALDTGCAFVNCIPSFIASDKAWERKFKKAGLPVIGDDIKGQIGATIVHRTLAKLTADRGAKVDRTYQLNVGGNTDFLNMKEKERLQSKKVSKTESVQSQLKERLPDDEIYVGPSDFIPFLGNTKLCFIRIEGKLYADVPFDIELRLNVDDKANSGGIVVDCIRFAKKALKEKKSGFQKVSCYYMKHPLYQISDPEARDLVEREAK
jgi:myo-inositol-1-phosphate synthase